MGVLILRKLILSASTFTVVLIAGALGAGAASATTSRQVRIGSAPRRPAGSRVLGSLPAGTALR